MIKRHIVEELLRLLDEYPVVTLLGPRQAGRELTAIEIKSSSTYNPALLKGLKKMAILTEQILRSYLVYSGDTFKFSNGITVLKYDQISSVFTQR